MSLEKICFLTNYNQYETKRYFTEKLAEALRREGVEVLVLDAGEQTIGEKEITKIFDFSPDLTASFNSFIPDDEGNFLWDLMKCPHLSILVDPSIYSLGLIRSPYSIISCVDEFDLGGLLSQKFERAFLFHHAVEKELETVLEEEKEFDVVFFGSCYDYETLQKDWRRKYGSAVADILDRATDMVLAHRDMPLQEAFMRSWQESERPRGSNDFLTLFRLVDSCSRGRDRVALVRSIKNACVHVFGEVGEDERGAKHGWNHYLGDMGNVKVHPPVSYGEAMKLMRKAKISLNSAPFFKSGSHERMLIAPACHALAATTDTIFSRKSFVDEEDILLYDSSNVEGFGDKVDRFLNDEERRYAAVTAARKKVFSEYTWDNRALELKAALPPILQSMLVK